MIEYWLRGKIVTKEEFYLDKYMERLKLLADLRRATLAEMNLDPELAALKREKSKGSLHV